MKGRCVCGCGRRGRHRHHVVSRFEIKRHTRPGERRRWMVDARNLVWLAVDCHGAHTDALPKLPLRVLPDSAFEFARQLMGPGPAYNYLRRTYDGGDERLDALLS